MADWFKIYENDIDEMRLQWAIGELPEVLNVWIVILSEACRHKDGTLSGYKEDFELFGISKRINVPVPIVNKGIELLVKIGYLTRLENQSLLIRKWSDKQSQYCQKKTRLQSQSGENHWSRTKNSENCLDSVSTVSGQCLDSVPQEERRGEENRREYKEGSAVEETSSLKEKTKRGSSAPRLTAVSFLIPSILNTERFINVWNSWLEYRSRLKKVSSPHMFREQLEKLASWGEESACESLKNSMMNGWQGIFEPKNGNHKKRPREVI